MDDNLLHLLRQKLVDGIAMPLPVLTRRDTWIPRLAGKVLAVIGMRRSGKTSLLWQELSDRLASPGMERSGLPWISLEDERLIGSGPELLDTNVLSESMRERPAFARRQINGGFEGPAHSGAGIL